MTESSKFFKPFPQSHRIYVPGKLFPDIRVSMREVEISDPLTPKLGIYDTSGPYGDPQKKIDVNQGIEKIRKPWIDARKKNGEPLTQMQYAKKGIITPEMEYVAIRGLTVLSKRGIKTDISFL